MWLLWCSG